MGTEDKAGESRIDERIGLLFVHGVGEQKRWEHLHSSVLELAELIRRTDGGAPSVTIIDRTEDWKFPAGTPDPDGRAPLSMDVRLPDKRIRFECHEVWWADLGTRSGLLDAARFWLWGLGQWCAPIYRDMDVSRVARPAGTGGARLTEMPRSVVGRVREVGVRLQLFTAALAAAFVACTWSLAKRLFATLFGQAPSPTLIVQYVGDIRTFTQRAAPGDSALTDPGFPRRVGIRRRMISEMVALAAREDVAEWYVLAHSLGTVVAYNGLTEIGHTLPNYLSEAQWRGGVPDDWKRDPATLKRDDEIGKMMPARPHWVEDDQVIDRRKLFAKLRGFLTYGSPLDKFSGLWPRIVATATDRTDGNPFPAECKWVNLYAPTDPVAGRIDCYQHLDDVLPPLRNCRTRWTILAGLEHITYFKGFERYRKKWGQQRLSVVRWLMGGKTDQIPMRRRWAFPARLFAWLLFALLLGLLWAITTTIFVLARSAWDGSASSSGKRFFDWAGFTDSFWTTLGPALSLFLAPILLVGVYRWASETWLNCRLAKADRLPAKVRSALRWNLLAAWTMTIFSLPLIYFGKALELGWWLPALVRVWGERLLAWVPHGWLVALLCGTGLVIAAGLQAWANSRDPK